VIAGTPTWIWVSFIGAILALLVFDLTVLQRRHPEPTLKLAAKWTAFWVGLGMAFGVLIWQFWPNIAPGSPIAGSEAALLYLTGYIVEESLSIDNIFVFLIIFSYFNVPDSARHKVLFLGILGAIIFRAIFIFAGSALLHQFAWLELVFGALLIFSGIKLLKSHDDPLDPESSRVLKFLSKRFRMTNDFEGQKLFLKRQGLLFATPLFLCLIFIEFSDIVFAIDSIPAILSITREPFIVFTSNIFAILGLRALFFCVSGLLKLLKYLNYGLAAILSFVGLKMAGTYIIHTFINKDWHMNVFWSLGVISAILTITVWASWMHRDRTRPTA
jgi:tellurite resistance protein TerC